MEKDSRKGESGEAEALAKIEAMGERFGEMGRRLHALILRNAPGLAPRVWYGMPAYMKDGKTVCFFRADQKYMTFGFTQDADLRCAEGSGHQLIASAWYFTALDDATEAELGTIVAEAFGGKGGMHG